jgi:hypothetical protein
MRNIVLLLLFLLTFKGVFAQTPADQSQIIQKCLDLSEIQQYLPSDLQGNHLPAYIMQLPMVLPEDADVTKFGKKPVYLNRTEMYANNTEAFFQFREITIEQSSARVLFTFNCNYTQPQQKVLHYTILLQKNDNDWTITSTELTGGIQ